MKTTKYELITARGSSKDQGKDRGFLAGDKDNLYILSPNKEVIKTIPLKTITKVRVKYMLMYVYTKWWWFINKENVFNFEAPQEMQKSTYQRIRAIPRRRGMVSSKQYYSEIYIDNQPPEFKLWEKFFIGHNVQVSVASWYYYWWMSSGR